MYLDRFGFRLWSKWKPTSGAFFEARGTSVSSMTRYPDRRREVGDEDLAEALRNGNPGPLSPFEPFEIGRPLSARRDGEKGLGDETPVRDQGADEEFEEGQDGRFGTAWTRRVSQAQRGVGIGVSMGRNRRTSNTLQLRALPTRRAREAGARRHPE